MTIQFGAGKLFDQPGSGIELRAKTLFALSLSLSVKASRTPMDRKQRSPPTEEQPSLRSPWRELADPFDLLNAIAPRGGRCSWVVCALTQT